MLKLFKKNKLVESDSSTQDSLKTFLHIFILILLPVLVYHQVLRFDYTGFDDIVIIKKNTGILGDILNFKYLFQSDAFLQKPGIAFYRPVQSLSFMFDAIAGNNDLWMYHFSNLLIHILTAVSLYFLLITISIDKHISFLFALLFSVHPLFASNVSWIPARGDLLICLMGIWLFILFVRHLSTGKRSFFLLHSLFYLALVNTKETALLFPVVLIFYYWFFFKNSVGLKKLFPYLLIWSLIILMNLIVRTYVLTGKGAIDSVQLIVFIKNLPSIPVMTGKFFIPQNLSTLCLFDTRSIVIGVFFFLLLLVIAIKGIKKRQMIIVFGFVWYLLFISLPIFSKVNFAENYFQYLEHRAYLPSVGLIVLLSSLLQNNYKKFNLYLLNMICAILVMVFSFFAFKHSQDYNDTFTFYTAAIVSSPEQNAYAYTNRGIAYSKLHNYAEAIADQESALSILNNYEIFYNKGCLEMDVAENEKALKDFSEVIIRKPDFSAGYINRAVIYDRIKKYDSALIDILKAETLDHRNDILFCKKGNILLHLKRFDEAVENYSTCIALNPRNNEAFNKRAMAFYFLKKFDKATEDCNKLLELNIENDVAYNNLGIINLEQEKYQEAISWFSKAINANNNFADMYFNRGRAELKLNKRNDACKDWDIAVQMGFSYAKDSIYRYCK